MLRYVGHTAVNNRYFFRDFPEPMNFGMFTDFFNVAQGDCDLGGDLHAERGVIFVR